MPAESLQLGQRRLPLPQLWLLVPAAVCLACVQQEAAGLGLHEEHQEQYVNRSETQAEPPAPGLGLTCT